MPPTTPKTRPATKAEIEQILANACRALSLSAPADQEALLPPAYQADFKRRLAVFLGIEGGNSAERSNSRVKALQATIAQIENDVALGLLTIEETSQAAL